MLISTYVLVYLFCLQFRPVVMGNKRIEASFPLIVSRIVIN